MIAIIDYGMGNVRSVYNALQFVGQDAVISSVPRDIKEASHIILPGVGAFGDAMNNLRNSNLIETLNREVLERGKPFLGICLGMQLLAKIGYEYGQHQGLRWLDAEVVKFDTDDKDLKIPHVGWNNIEFRREHPLFAKLSENHADFYFVHSFHVQCMDKSNIAASCEYGYTFTAAVCQNNIFGTQFHPEKSQENGIQLLENFANWRP